MRSPKQRAGRRRAEVQSTHRTRRRIRGFRALSTALTIMVFGAASCGVHRHPDRIMARAEILDQMGDMSRAIVELRKAEKNPATKADAAKYLANIEERKVKAREALVDLDVELESNPHKDFLYKYHFRRGIVFETLGENEKARESYEKAIEGKANKSMSYLRRGLLRERTGDVAGAQADLEKSLALEPRDPFGNFHMGLFLIRRGRPAAAGPFAEKLKEKWPDLSQVIREDIDEAMKPTAGRYFQ